METAIDYGRAQKAERLVLGVWPENHRALAFYRRNGFEMLGSSLARLERVFTKTWCWRNPWLEPVCVIKPRRLVLVDFRPSGNRLKASHGQASGSVTLPFRMDNWLEAVYDNVIQGVK